MYIIIYHSKAVLILFYHLRSRLPLRLNSYHSVVRKTVLQVIFTGDLELIAQFYNQVRLSNDWYIIKTEVYFALKFSRLQAAKRLTFDVLLMLEHLLTVSFFRDLLPPCLNGKKTISS